jgi:protein SERAC1
MYRKKGEGGIDAAAQQDSTDPIGPLELFNTCETKDSGIDLVFVHGLRGSRIKTWSSKNNICWPRDLLPDDVEHARAITWGYDSSVANLFSYASKESIFGHADTLLNDLARLRRDVVCSTPGTV